jgi:hypothetical protein
MAGAVPIQIMQGIEVPTSSINPAEFFRLTRRLTILEKNLAAFAGLGSTDTIPILQTGVLSGIMVQFTGVLTVTAGSGTVATTGRWPYDLPRAMRFTANGQSNLINCHGGVLKAREIMARGSLTDRGVTRGIGGASPGTQVSQGTLSLNTESWGVGQSVTAIPTGTYNVELEWYVPIAFDDLTLQGAIFAQTSATDLYLAVDWAPQSDLFQLTGNATVALAGSVNAFATLYTIPQAPSGDIIIPDLSVFHSLIESRVSTLGNGDNEIRLAGQGVGKQLLRIFGRTWNNGTTTQVQLPVNTTNYGQILWRFGGNDTPETWSNGSAHSHRVEKLFDVDLCTYGGWWCHDFASENAFRDSIDEGTATELRYLINLQNSVTLTNAFAEYTQETVSIGSAA